VIEKAGPDGVALAMNRCDDVFGSYLPTLSAWQFGGAQAAAISQPVLSVLGTESERWFADGHELLHTWFPRVEACRIEGVAHLLHLQRPEPVARALAGFMSRHPIKG
jgi:pimeloyl-ACP methyl ester carboxylesterase